MVCTISHPVYRPEVQGGINLASSRNDGYSILIQWDKAWPSISTYVVAYNIYYSTIREDVFTEGVKFVALDDGYLNTCILDLSPGITYWFGLRSTEQDQTWSNLALLADGFPNLKVYTEGLLLNDIDDSTLIIPVSNIDEWPAFGVIQVGTELMRYTSKDVPGSTLMALDRGFLDTNVRFHDTDGYDGVATRDPIVRFWKGFEDSSNAVIQETSTFAYPNHAFTVADGYARQNDTITTDMTSSDAALADFPAYDHVGWHRTNPQQLFDGECIGTFIGGEQYCADGYGGVGRQLRGIPFSEHAARREEELLNITGEEVVLVRRMFSGIRCACVLRTAEQPEPRCAKCFGTGLVTGYNQFFNPRRSDGRIMVRADPNTDDLKFYNAGLESEVIINFWTLGFPAIKDRDFIIRFNPDGTEEFRYEVLDVTRNKLFGQTFGGQKFRAQRVRRSEPIYMWKAIRSTATMPTTLTTGIGFMRGPGGALIPHTHNIVINEGIVSLGQINQTSSISEDHNHEVRDGVIQEELGHIHTIILP